MDISKEFVVREDEKETRIDKLLANLLPDLSRSKWQGLIEDGQVTVAGAERKSSYRVKPGEKVEIKIPEDYDSQELVPQDLPLNVVYEDSALIGVNKPSPMVVHPGPGHEKGTLANALAFNYPDLPEIPDSTRPGIVHRLDKDTSGILAVARTGTAYEGLKDQFKEREVGKAYLALVSGRFEEEGGLINAPIGRSTKDKTRMTVKLGGKDSKTKFRVLDEFEDRSLLEVRPVTGRTHQIRVHMDYIDHRIVGDSYYGGEPHDRLMLHSRSLSVKHPETGEALTLNAPVPEEFEDLI
jgi:23S rRNA pseudouridine1911/1915/1917 synthase